LERIFKSESEEFINRNLGKRGSQTHNRNGENKKCQTK
jgi:hypothetical protein